MYKADASYTLQHKNKHIDQQLWRQKNKQRAGTC